MQPTTLLLSALAAVAQATTTRFRMMAAAAHYDFQISNFTATQSANSSIISYSFDATGQNNTDVTGWPRSFIASCVLSANVGEWYQFCDVADPGKPDYKRFAARLDTVNGTVTPAASGVNKTNSDVKPAAASDYDQDNEPLAANLYVSFAWYNTSSTHYNTSGHHLVPVNTNDLVEFRVTPDTLWGAA